MLDLEESWNSQPSEFITGPFLNEASTKAMLVPVGSAYSSSCNEVGELKKKQSKNSHLPDLTGDSIDRGPDDLGLSWEHTGLSTQVFRGNTGWLDRNVRYSDPHQHFVLSTPSLPIHPDKTMKMNTAVTSRSVLSPYFSQKADFKGGGGGGGSFITIVENVSG